MVTVFGLGFVGLTTALGFADAGIKVYGVDVDAVRTKTIASGELPFLEPGLDEALRRNINKTFFVTEDIKTAVQNSDYIFYCVGTPYTSDGSADLSYLFKAVDSTLEQLEHGQFKVLVTKSTIPPSTTSERVIPYIIEKGWEPGSDIGVANNPEFLREGHCWEDFVGADRIVLGVEDERTGDMLEKLYSFSAAPVFRVSYNTGEFIKYLSNTLLATMISFSNEMSVIADYVGNVQVADAFRILHMDKRWNECDMKSYVYPGCGYGGYCLPKDTKALYAQANKKGVDPQMLKNTIATNEAMPRIIAKRITEGLPKHSKIGILGLAFKPHSDDVRDTPSAKIIPLIQELGYRDILAYDPVANEAFENTYKTGITYCTSIEELESKSDVIAILTAWPQFKRQYEPGKRVVDCRFIL